MMRVSLGLEVAEKASDAQIVLAQTIHILVISLILLISIIFVGWIFRKAADARADGRIRDAIENAKYQHILDVDKGLRQARVADEVNEIRADRAEHPLDSLLPKTVSSSESMAPASQPTQVAKKDKGAGTGNPAVRL